MNPDYKQTNNPELNMYISNSKVCRVLRWLFLKTGAGMFLKLHKSWVVLVIKRWKSKNKPAANPGMPPQQNRYLNRNMGWHGNVPTYELRLTGWPFVFFQIPDAETRPSEPGVTAEQICAQSIQVIFKTGFVDLIAIVHVQSVSFSRGGLLMASAQVVKCEPAAPPNASIATPAIQTLINSLKVPR